MIEHSYMYFIIVCRELEVNGSMIPTFHADDFILKVTVSKVTENINRVTEKLPENIGKLPENVKKLPENHLEIIERIMRNSFG